MRVVLVDHDPAVLATAARALQGLIDCVQVTSKNDCLARLREGGYDIVVACERLADGSGLDLLATLGMSEPDVLRIFAADGERLKKLGGHLAPFKLFDTIGYPLDSMQLRSAMALAIAERGDLLSGEFENIVLGSDPLPEDTAAESQAVEAQPQIVLLTRDSAALESAQAALADKRYRVIAARDADEARADLVARQPVLALVDVGALGMDPVNWFVEAHRASPTTLLLALGRRNDGQMLEPLVANRVVDRFVAKPITQAGMRLVLESALRLQAISPTHSTPLPMPSSVPTPAAIAPAEAPLVARKSGAPLATVEWQPPGAIPRKAGGGPRSAAGSPREPLRISLPLVLALAAVLAFGVAWFYFSYADKPAVAPVPVARVAPPPAVPSPGDALVARIEAALTRGDAAAARASLDELQRIDPRHGRLALLVTLVARAEEARQLARAPTLRPVTAAQPEGAPQPDASPPSTMATTSIAPGATLPSAVPGAAPGAAPGGPPLAPSGPAREPVPTPAPEAAPAPVPANFAGTASTPVASPTDLRPSKLTAVSFAGRTLEDSANPSAPVPAPAQRRVEPDRPQPVVMEMKLLRRVSPDYPEEARRKNLEGSVELAFVVGADGRVKDVEVAGSSAPGMFDAEAIAAVKRWRYDPRREDGVPVDFPAKVHLEFRLDK